MYQAYCTNCGHCIKSVDFQALILSLPNNGCCPFCVVPVQYKMRIHQGYYRSPTYLLHYQRDLNGQPYNFTFDPVPAYNRPQGGNVSPPSRYGGYGYKRPSSTNYPGAPPTKTQTQTRCEITWDHQAEAYSVSAPWDPNFYEVIKAKIPGGERAWIPKPTEVWMINDKWFDFVKLLADELWPGGVRVTTRKEVEDAVKLTLEQQRTTILASLPSKERALFEFMTICPYEALKTAYRKAAMELHPDRNQGNGEMMTRLNDAWAKIQKEFENVNK